MVILKGDLFQGTCNIMFPGICVLYAEHIHEKRSKIWYKTDILLK